MYIGEAISWLLEHILLMVNLLPDWNPSVYTRVIELKAFSIVTVMMIEVMQEIPMVLQGVEP